MRVLVSVAFKKLWYDFMIVLISLTLFSGIMDQDYECRLLRQINIQNENASPIVSKQYTHFLCLLCPWPCT